MSAQVFGEVWLTDADGLPVRDAATLAASRVLLVAECAARFLQSIDGMGWGNETEINRLASVLALNVIRATEGAGKQLAGDVRETALLLGFDYQVHNAQLNRERMDS